MYKVNYVRALVTACVYWGWIADWQRDVNDASAADAAGEVSVTLIDEGIRLREEFDRAMAPFGWDTSGVPAPMLAALEEIRRDDGEARRIVADLCGRRFPHAIDVHAFGLGWEGAPRISVFASGRARRAYARTHERVAA